MTFMGTWVPQLINAIADEHNDKISFSLATISPDGFPKVRTCIFRDFVFNDPSTNVLTFYSDKRSDKINQLKLNNKYEACFNFKNSKKQFRISGFTKIIDYDFLNSKNSPNDIGIIQTRYSTELEPTTIIEQQSQSTTQQNDKKLLYSSSTSEISCYSDNLDAALSPSLSSASSNTSNPNDYDYYRLYSPSLTSNYNYFNNYDLELDMNKIPPPSKNEWLNEINRHWYKLSSNSKSYYRKPLTSTLLTNDNINYLDSLSRNVDGNNEDDGLKNFALILLFVDKVNYIDYEAMNGAGQAIISQRIDINEWIETEVCP